jgi:hypothetical protein
MAQAPQTSSMQLCSQTTGSTRSPETVTGFSRSDHQQRDDVVVGMAGNRKFLPIGRAVGTVLTADAQMDRLLGHR